MKIIVFGATGGVGQHAVRRAAEAGHQVTAFVRSPDKLELPAGVLGDTVIVRQGDAFDGAAVSAAIEGHDAVIFALASSRALKKSDELERMAQNIASGMSDGGVSRIVYCASAGVDGELAGVVGKAVAWVLRNALADHRCALDLFDAAGRNLTIARPTTLSNGDFIADYVETFEGMPRAARPIPRASVADFLVKALEQPERYSNTSVGLSL